MAATLIDGNLLSKKIREEIRERAAKIKLIKGQPPGLAVILVGENPASQVYVSSKAKACGEVGFHSVLERYPATSGELDLLKRIESLNHDPTINGILVQLPLPEHIDTKKGCG